MLQGIAEMMSARSLNYLPLCSCTHENLLVEISGALGMKGSHFLNKNVF